MTRNLFEYHPLIGYRYIPFLRARVRHEGGGYIVRANSTGFRSDHDFDSPKCEHVFRVAIYGDSYTAGEGVSNGERYSDLLENYVAGTQIFNLALPGTGTDQQYLTFQEFGDSVTPDMVLICPLVENILRNLDSARLTQKSSDGRLVMRPKPYFTFNDGELQLHHVPVPKNVVDINSSDIAKYSSDGDSPSLLRKKLRKVNAKLDRVIPGFREWTQRVRKLSLPEQYQRADDPAWKLMSAILEKWVLESKVRVVICPIPTYAHLFRVSTSDDYLARFKELTDKTGAELVDILPNLLSHPIDLLRRSRFPVDEHPNRLGHKLIADALRPHLENWVRDRKI